MINATSSTDRDVGSFEATSGGSPFMSSEKSETITTPQGVKNGDK